MRTIPISNNTVGVADTNQHINTRDGAISGVFLARVIQNTDQQYNGRFEVELLDGLAPPNDDLAEGKFRNTRTILPTSPFGGTTSASTATDNKNIETSQVSYGMAPQAPPVGATVLVAFIPQQREGFYLGSLFDKDRNYSIPGLAHAKVDDRGTRAPASELNPNTTDFNKKNRAPHPSTANLAESGLAGDYIRGLSSSGMRRDTANNAFGFKTKSGHSIVMDDGSAAGTDASIRIRTASGAQILLHDEAATIYIANAVGSGYVEIDNAGHIDVYGKMFSVHAEEEINLKSGGAMNFEANEINMKSTAGGIKMEASVGSIEAHAAVNINLSADADGNLNFSGGHLKATASRIDWNGPPATKAEKPIPGALTRNTGVTESINGRVPEHEPWGGRDTFASQSTGGNETDGGPV